MPIRRSASFALVAGLLAIAVWISVRSDRAPDDAGDDVERATVTRNDPSAAPTLVRPGDEAELGRTAVAEPPAQPEAFASVDAPGTPSTPGPASDRFILELDVRGPSSADAATVKVRGRSDGEPFVTGEPVVATCGVQAVTRIDLSPLLEGRHAVAMLLVEAEHAALRAKRLAVDVNMALGDDGRYPGPVRATLTLERGFSVRGRVASSACAPDESRVALWKIVDGRAVGRPVARAEVDEDGSFELAAPRAANYLVVAAHARCSPAARSAWTTAAAPRVDVGVLELDAASSVDGQVTVGGAPPPTPVSFSLERIGESELLGSDWGDSDSALSGLSFEDPRVTRIVRGVVTDEDGAFQCEGLSPGEYRVSVHGYTTGHMRAERPELTVLVPSSGCRIELALAVLRVTLVPPEGDVIPSDGTLRLEIEGREPEDVDAKGGKLWGSESCDFVLTPGALCDLTFEPDSGPSASHSVVAPSAGGVVEVAIGVPEAEAVGALEVRLTGDVPAVGTMFVVDTEEESPDGPSSGFGGFSGPSAFTVPLQEGGILRVDGVMAGSVRVLVYPGTWVGHRGSYHLDARGRADVPEGGTGRLDLELQLGGKLKIGKRDGAGGWSEASCVVRDADGRSLNPIFTAYAEDGGGAAAAHGMLTDYAPSVIFPNPAPGRYTVVVDGITRDVDVRAGETTTVLFD
ncbi:MAG: carboxypeptidase-like regulatory domain-containing protein [Planctomycetota bacterium]